MDSQTQLDWQYHDSEVVRRKRMKLLSFEQYQDDFIYDLLIRHAYMLAGKKTTTKEYTRSFISPETRSDLSSRMHQHLLYVRRKPGEFKEDIHSYHIEALAATLNAIFTDEGWRMMLRRISQKKKRSKTNRPIVDHDLQLRMQNLIEKEKLSSWSDALDFLLTYYQDSEAGNV